MIDYKFNVNTKFNYQTFAVDRNNVYIFATKQFYFNILVGKLGGYISYFTHTLDRSLEIRSLTFDFHLHSGNVYFVASPVQLSCESCQ